MLPENRKNWEIRSTEENSDAIVVTKDGTAHEGKYKGLDSLEYDRYKRAYRIVELEKPNGICLPSIGDLVEVKTKKDTFSDLIFLGFEYEQNPPKAVSVFSSMNAAQYYETDGHSRKLIRHYAKFRQLNKTETIKVHFIKIRQIAFGNGRFVSIEELEWLLDNKKLPIKTAVRLSTKSGERTIPFSEISNLKVSKEPDKKTSFLIVGAIFDGILITGAICYFRSGIFKDSR